MHVFEKELQKIRLNKSVHGFYIFYRFAYGHFKVHTLYFTPTPCSFSSACTITKEFKIYGYSELSQEAKDKVRNDYINNLDSSIFTEQIIEDLREKRLENLRPYYSLSYCQGDGICLYGDIGFEEITDELKNIFYQDFKLSDYKVLKNLKEYSQISFNHSGRYYHKYSVDIDIYIDGNLSSKSHENRREIADRLLRNIKEWYLNVCDECEK